MFFFFFKIGLQNFLPPFIIIIYPVSILEKISLWGELHLLRHVYQKKDETYVESSLLLQITIKPKS